jgi:hypothetical protein
MLAKEIEFPLFHLGTVPDSTGTPVKFTPELLREMARNSNFVTQAGILHAPIKYDHPAHGAADKENHGKMVRYEVRGNSLFAVGTNWSDRVKADKAEEKRIAYSGEFVNEFSYPDPASGKMVKLGPTVVGLALLGSDRPAFKNLKPFSAFEFSEEISPVDAHETRQELRSAGLLSEYCDGTHFYAEVENDARRFSERQEQTMTDAEIQAAIAAGVAPLKTANDTLVASNKELSDQLRQFTETSARKTAAHEFTESLKTDKKYLGKIPTEMLEDILADPTMPAPVATKVKAFCAALPAFIAPGGVAGKKADADGDDDDVDEPKNLAALRPKHFAERSKYELMLVAGTDELQTIKPKLFSEAKATTVEARLAVTKQYVIEREAAAN